MTVAPEGPGIRRFVRAVVARGEPFRHVGYAFHDVDVAHDEVRAFRDDGEPVVLRVAVSDDDPNAQRSIAGDWLCCDGVEPRRLTTLDWYYGDPHPTWPTGRPIVEAWEDCPDGNWLLEAACALGASRRDVARALVAAVRTVFDGPVPQDPRMAESLRAVEGWSRRETPVDEIVRLSNDFRLDTEDRSVACHQRSAVLWLLLYASTTSSTALYAYAHASRALEHVVLGRTLLHIERKLPRLDDVRAALQRALADVVRAHIPLCGVLRAAASTYAPYVPKKVAPTRGDDVNTPLSLDLFLRPADDFRGSFIFHGRYGREDDALRVLDQLHPPPEPTIVRVQKSGGSPDVARHVHRDWLLMPNRPHPRPIRQPAWDFSERSRAWAAPRRWLEAWEECEDACWMLHAAASMGCSRRLVTKVLCDCLDLLPGGAGGFEANLGLALQEVRAWSGRAGSRDPIHRHVWPVSALTVDTGRSAVVRQVAERVLHVVRYASGGTDDEPRFGFVEAEMALAGLPELLQRLQASLFQPAEVVRATLPTVEMLGKASA